MYDMKNFKKDILDTLKTDCDNEQIKAIVIGELFLYEDQCDDDPRKIERGKLGKILPWEDASKLLDYDFYAGYGGVDCHPIYVWTDNYIIIVSIYDGASWLSVVPRNPKEIMPCFYGSG